MATSMPSKEMSDGDILRVKNWLNESSIKLWLSPLTKESGEPGCELQEIIAAVSKSLNLDLEIGAICVEKLRLQALENLAAKKKYEETSQATLRVKVNQGDYQGSRNTIKVSLPLSATGRCLKEAVSEQSGLSSDAMKLIFKGHLLKEDLNLGEQGVRNNALIMLLSVDGGSGTASSKTSEEDHRRNELLNDVRTIRRAAEYLAARAADDKFYRSGLNLNITNQSGQELSLPVAEKQALVLAMALHSKGKACLERDSFDLALPLLLEADDEFNKCGSELLSSTDNHAILQLDIVWCYFKLQSISELPDAENRLTLCERKFEQTYGSNMKRVMELHGGAKPEVILYLRLYILQGITAFYQNRWQAASSLLSKATELMQSLTVPEEKLNAVKEYGFSTLEARVGLRACDHRVEQAVDYILQMREKKNKMSEREKAQANLKRAKRFGKTADGSWINMEMYDSLIEMGFKRLLVEEALRQTNNNLERSIEIMQNNREMLLANIRSRKLKRRRPQVSQTDAKILVNMGYTSDEAEWALMKCHADVNAAADLLAKGTQDIGDESSDSSSSSSEDEDKNSRRAQEEEMIEVLMPDVRGDLYEHLDSDLSDEQELLAKLSSLMKR